jgi:ABC-type sugar transport system permease subunit
MPSVVVAHTWRGFPFCPTSFLAGIQTIPQELYEATPVDGASRWQQFCYITLSGLYHLTFTVPFCAWMFIGYFRSLPSKLEEPAMVDDYTKVRALFRILLPLPAPALVAPAIFSFTLA